MRAAEVALTDEQRATLRGWLGAGKTERRMAFRAEVILAIAEGLSNKAVAERVGTRPATVSKWRGRFAQEGISGLRDASRSGKPRQYQGEHERRILAALDEPAFAQKAADIVGLYLQPPENAVVFSVDEKPHIQALERAQGWLKLPNGKAVTGFSHAYKRHGTTTLFAALDVATGLVKTGHYQRRRRVEFLDFMNRVVAEHTGREIHVILDNLNTHKPKHDRWLARHKNVHFHFTPTHASWLNQVEVWFSILSAKALAGASFTSPRQVRDQIDAFINAYNQTAHPFEWTKQVVFSQHPRAKYADLCN
jgi:transposase